MLPVKRTRSIFKKVNLLLIKGADRLTAGELVQINEVAERSGAVIYVSIPSWQIFLSIPVLQQREVWELLRKSGYDSVRITRKVNARSTLQLRGKRSGPSAIASHEKI